MCGRYVIINRKRAILKWKDLSTVFLDGILIDLVPRYNAAPKQKIPVVAVRDNKTKVELMQWGLFVGGRL